MIELYLARHGQTVENVARIFQGHLPGQLTDEGRCQAEALREKLRQLEFDMIVSSDLQRCIDTVQIAADDRNLPWVKTELLREVDWGEWTGLAINSVNIKQLPSHAETKEMLYARAGKFVDFLKANFDGKRVFAVGHGLINRSVEAWLTGIPVTDLYQIPKMENAGLRHFILK